MAIVGMRVSCFPESTSGCRILILLLQFAKLEMSIIGAAFTAMFDYSLVDPNGNPIKEVPVVDRNRHAAHKPVKPLRLKYQLRQQPG